MPEAHVCNDVVRGYEAVHFSLHIMDATGVWRTVKQAPDRDLTGKASNQISLLTHRVEK